MEGTFARHRRGSLLLMIAMVACDSETPAAPMAPLPLLVAGCEDLDEHERCAVLPGDALRIWVDGDTRPTLTVEGTSDAFEVAPERARLGWRWNLTVEPEWNAVHVLRGHTEARLRLVAPTVPEPIREARAARAAGDLDRAEAILQAFTPRDPHGRGLREGMLARLAFSRGDNEGCLAHYDAARPLLERAGARGQIVSDGLAAAFVLHRRLGRVGDAQRHLDALEPFVSDAVGRVRWNLTRGTLEHALGDLRGALGTLELASRDGHRLGMLTEAAGADEIRADALIRLGRIEEADRLMDQLEALMDGAAPCTRATFLANLGHQRTKTDDRARLRSALEPLRAARDLFASECDRAASLANAHLNLAHAELRLGAIDRARAELSRAATIDANDATIAAWVLELELALAVEAEAFDEALVAADALERRARASGWLRSIWWARLGRGRALLGLGRTSDAAAALDEAEAVLDRLYQRLPLDGAQGLALGEHDASASARVALAVAVGDAEGALRVARHARRRRLGAAHRAVRVQGGAPVAALERYWARRRELSERAEERWALPVDRLAEHAAQSEALEARALEELDDAFPPLDTSLPPLPSGALVLVLFPTDAGLAVVASHGGDHRAAIREEGEALTGLDEWLEEATEVRVLAHGRATALDVHRWPWRDGALGASVAVSYGLDRPAVEADLAPGVLIVSDPRGDLAEARSEASAVVHAWRERGVPVRELRGDAATHDAFVEALSSVGRLHYAGHGDARRAGLWGSQLPLAAGERLTAADVLALRSVPAEVVLSGCETGEPEGGVLALGLAHAFVAAGASRVIGSTRAVDDDVAARVGRTLGALPAERWAEQLRRLNRELGEGAAPFRLYVP